MAAKVSLLNRLRERTKVSCDTLDASVPQKLGPFQDCTSNQAIALADFKNGDNKSLLQSAAREAVTLSPSHNNVSKEALAVEIATVQLSLHILPHINGRMHVQVNPFDAYSTPRICAGAVRLLQLAKHLDSSVDTSRYVIKIPSTWEGLKACRELEKDGIKTLATTLFAFEQAVVAADAGCHYIAPYLHDLRYVIRYPDFKEERTSQTAIVNGLALEEYFERHSYKTHVIPAALTTPDECFELDGINRMTISPALLEKLATQTGSDDFVAKKVAQPSENQAKVRVRLSDMPAPSEVAFIRDEPAFRMAMSRRDNGLAESTQVYAINEFCEAQLALEEIMKPHLKECLR